MSTRQIAYVGGAVVIGATGLYYAIRWLQRAVKDIRYPFVPIGTVAELYIYPVKSCRGQQVEALEVTKLGGRNGDLRDRHFCVYVKSTLVNLDAKQCASLVVVEPNVQNGILTLSAPGHKPVSVDIEEVIERHNVVTVRLFGNVRQAGLDCGAEVGKWIANVLGKEDEFGLLCYVDGLYSERWSRRKYGWLFSWIPRNEKIAYPYVAPFLGLNSASISDIRSRCGNNKPFNARYFRGNIVIDGCSAFDEDWWMELKIGDAVFDCYEPCPRCHVITINPANGVQDPDGQPLRELRRYRLAPEGKLRKLFQQKPFFGVFMGVNECGTIHVGDKVLARYNRKPYQIS
ncbi:unnamed protein product [Anisakis simplex]|uniref:MOSC domain-containing protein n=1 Tax=Anisakis simplex TaxID=6269 RepID=A0A0M3K1U3_ANISI|nr:unnamed protein product [Anisakis simplex]